MAFQPVPDTIEVVARYSRGPDPTSADWTVINVHHWRDTVTPWGATTIGSMLDEVEAWWEAEAKPLAPTNLRLYDLTGTDLEVQNGVQVVHVVDSLGTAGGNETNPILSGVIKYRGDAGAFPRRGLSYWGGLYDTVVIGDRLDTTYAADLRAAYEALVALDNGGTAAFALVSRFSGSSLVQQPDGQVLRRPTPRAAGVTNTVDTVSVREVVGSQERRRRGG